MTWNLWECILLMCAEARAFLSAEHLFINLPASISPRPMNTMHSNLTAQPQEQLAGAGQSARYQQTINTIT